MEFHWTLIFSSFMAGVITFLAPCTLPLIPAFLAVISGVSAADSKETLQTHHKRIVINALFYVFGFSIVFILIGSAITFAIHILAVKSIIQKIGGLFLVILGLTTGGWLRLNFLSRFQRSVGYQSEKTGPAHSFILGALFSLSWTPCIGPILGSILLLASLPSAVFSGVVLLSIFCLGLGLPFIIIALIISRAVRDIGNWVVWAEKFSKIGGVIIIIFGVLMLAGQFESVLGRLISALFLFENYERFIYDFM